MRVNLASQAHRATESGARSSMSSWPVARLQAASTQQWCTRTLLEKSAACFLCSRCQGACLHSSTWAQPSGTALLQLLASGLPCLHTAHGRGDYAGHPNQSSVWGGLSWQARHAGEHASRSRFKPSHVRCRPTLVLTTGGHASSPFSHAPDHFSWAVCLHP